MGLLTVINVLNYTDRNVVFALFEPLKRDLILTDQELGWLGSAYVIVLSLAALPLGVIGDLRSRRAVIAVGVSLWSVFTSLGGAVRSFWQLFLCRAAVGVGEAGYAPAAQAIIASFYRGPRRAFAIAIYSLGMAFGGVLGIWLGGELAERYGWRATFVLMGVPGLVLAVLASRLREPERRSPPGFRATVRRWMGHPVAPGSPFLWATALGGIGAGTIAVFQAAESHYAVALLGALAAVLSAWVVWRVINVATHHAGEARGVAATAAGEFTHAAAIVSRTPTLVWMFVGGALVTFAVNGLIAWSPSFMHRVHGMSVADVGRTFGGLALASSVLGALTGGRLGDRLMLRFGGGRVVAAGAGFVLGGPVCAGLLLVHNLVFFAPLLIATFFFYTWYTGPISAVIFDVVPAAVRSSVLGGYILFSHIAGDALAPPLVGYLSDHVGLRSAMLILPAAGVLGGMVILGALRTVSRDMERARAVAPES